MDCQLPRINIELDSGDDAIDENLLDALHMILSCRAIVEDIMSNYIMPHDMRLQLRMLIMHPDGTTFCADAIYAIICAMDLERLSEFGIEITDIDLLDAPENLIVAILLLADFDMNRLTMIYWDSEMPNEVNEIVFISYPFVDEEVTPERLLMNHVLISALIHTDQPERHTLTDQPNHVLMVNKGHNIQTYDSNDLPKHSKVVLGLFVHEDIM